MATVTIFTGDTIRPYGFNSGGTETPIAYRGAKIDWEDIKAIATYKIFILPAQSFVVNLWWVVTTLWTTGDAAVLQVESSDGTPSIYLAAAAGTVANMTAGAVLRSPSGDGTDHLSDVAGTDQDYIATERTVDITVSGSGAFTAGDAILLIGYVTLNE